MGLPKGYKLGKMSETHKDNISKAKMGLLLSKAHRKAISEGHMRRRKRIRWQKRLGLNFLRGL